MDLRTTVVLEGKTVKMVAFKAVCIFPLFRWIQKEQDTITISVADPRCLFRILIFFPSGSQIRTKYVEEELNIFLSYLFCSHKFHIIFKLFDFSKGSKKCEPIDKRIRTFNSKNFHYCLLSEIWFWDPGRDP